MFWGAMPYVDNLLVGRVVCTEELLSNADRTSLYTRARAAGRELPLQAPFLPLWNLPHPLTCHLVPHSHYMPHALHLFDPVLFIKY